MMLWQRLWQGFLKTVSPKHFYRISGLCLPWLTVVAALVLTTGLVWGLAFAPPDYQQGDSYRIIFIHVPAAALAMGGYLILAIASLIVLVWRVKTAEWVAEALAPIGAWFTLLSLVTGSLWGKPTWGTYWVWDARLTSMLILLFLYWGVIALQQDYAEGSHAGRAAALLSLVGVVNLPIIHYSVRWWNTLHQASTFSLGARPQMPPAMYLPLLLSLLGFYALFAVLLILRTRQRILVHEARTAWVREIVQAEVQARGI